MSTMECHVWARPLLSNKRSIPSIVLRTFNLHCINIMLIIMPECDEGSVSTWLLQRIPAANLYHRRLFPTHFLLLCKLVSIITALDRLFNPAWSLITSARMVSISVGFFETDPPPTRKKENLPFTFPQSFWPPLVIAFVISQQEKHSQR